MELSRSNYGDLDQAGCRAKFRGNRKLVSQSVSATAEVGKLGIFLNNKVELGRWGNRLLRALPHETLALMEPDLTRTALAQGAVCFEAGQRIDHVYFPLTGMISLVVATGDGEIVETGTIGCEGAAGLQSGFGGPPDTDNGERYSLATSHFGQRRHE